MLSSCFNICITAHPFLFKVNIGFEPYRDIFKKDFKKIVGVLLIKQQKLLFSGNKE